MMNENLPQGVEGLLNKINALPDVKSIMLYGSRARGDAADRSDFDVAIDAPDLSESDWNKIYWMVEEAETLYKIDCVWLQKTSGLLKENILKDAKVLFQK
jgi:uncharacterized protein